MNEDLSVFDLVGKPLSLGTLILLEHQAKEKARKNPKLKHKYIRFEIECGEYSFSHNKVMGIYYREDQSGKIKEVKEYVLSTGSAANNPLLDMLMPVFNSIAFENLSEFLKDKSKYFEN